MRQGKCSEILQTFPSVEVLTPVDAQLAKKQGVTVLPQQEVLCILQQQLLGGLTEQLGKEKGGEELHHQVPSC